ncbi:MAG: EAL domain-containing protein [Burkholderiales bacterium]|nr:EAL domain-containing protein [Burkholderiales bacterium]
MHQRDSDQLELALEAAGMDLWENDLITGSVIRKAGKIFSELGYAEDEAASSVEDIFRIIHPEDVQRVKTAIEAHFSGVTSRYRCEFRVRAKSGQWFWYANYGRIVDRERRFIGVTFNIDERKRSEERFRSIIESVPVPLAINDERGNITYLNDAFVRTIGYGPEEIPDLEKWWSIAYPDPQYRKEIAQAWKDALERANRSGHPFLPIQSRICCKDGNIRTFLISPATLGEDFSGLHLVVLYDITERKAAEDRIRRISKLYRALSEVNQAIIRMENEETLFPLVCRMAVDFGGMVLASIRKLNPDTDLLEPVASYGSGADYVANITISARKEIPEGRGPAGTAYREGNNIIITRYTQNDMTKPWHELAMRFGWGSSGTFPVLRDGKPFAILSVYHREEEAFDREAIDLLDEMTRDVSFALDSFDRERERLKARSALSESERHFRAYFERAMVGMAATSRESDWIEVNDALCKMLGYPREELIRTNWIDIIHPEDVEESMRFSARILSGEIDEYEQNKRYVRKDGSLLHAHIASRGVRNEAGEVDYFVVIVEDITEVRNQQKQLEFLVHHDPLTGLPNRVLLNDRLEMALSQADRSGGKIAVCFMDLDGFKPVNDTLGHAAGDALLVEVVKRLAAISRSTDTVVRLGGDEFILVLTNIAGKEECRAMLERVMEAICRPFEVAGKEIRISSSIGVSVYPDQVSDGTALLRNADQAMYIAKQQGRNRIHFFDFARDHLAGHGELSRIEIALQNRELHLHYQPKINMRTGEVIGMEALIRWQHPEKGLLMPGQFMPHVENSEFEIGLSEWVIRQAMSQLDAWRSQGLDLAVSVNLPARHLQSEGFVDFLASLMKQYPGLRGNLLKLEILETAAIGDMGSAIEKIEECIGLGIRFSIDDFGTGYASLSYLRRLPADTIKIDQSFVQGMLEDENDLSIVKGVIGLADAFRKQVVAEGVETVAHGEKLLAMGCEFGQGYGIARPMHAEQVAAWVGEFRVPPEWAALT